LTNGIILKKKGTITKIKKYLQNRRKIFARYSLDKGLITRTYEELKKLNTKRTNNPINKWINELNRLLSKEVQMVNKYK
jgi:hypothetical protein